MASSARIRSRASLLQIFRDPQRKSFPRIAWEAAAFKREKGEGPSQYFQSFLYRKGVRAPLRYLSRGDRERLNQLIMREEASLKLRRKHLFEEHFSQAPGVRLARHLGYAEEGTFRASNGSEFPLDTSKDLERMLERLLDNVRAHGGDSLFAKPTNMSRGRGIMKVTSSLPDPTLWESMQERGYVFQQTVAQHPKLAAVVPDTLNTMRITTVRREGEEPAVTSVWIRFGRVGGFVDNASAGGLFAGVDLATGRLARFCGSYFDKGGKVFTQHPDTGHPLFGGGRPAFEIPEFEAALEMALAAARHSDYPLVGWDVAVAHDGPVLIEANFKPDVHADEVANGAYVDNPVLGPFIQEITGGRGLSHMAQS